MVGRLPFGVAFTPDGSTAFVSNLGLPPPPTPRLEPLALLPTRALQPQERTGIAASLACLAVLVSSHQAGNNV